jgi:cytoskeletal protein CcmA (bactofilin family)
MSHFDELDYIRYIDGELTPARTSEVKAHLVECSSCNELVEALERETVLLREALIEADEKVSAEARPPVREELSWALLGVMGMAAFGMYTLWSRILVPWLERLQVVGMDFESLLAVVLFKGALWEGWSTMGKNLMQGTTLIVSALMVISALRWSWRRMKLSTLLVASVAVLLLMQPSAEAAVIDLDARHYVLEAGQVIDNDLIVAGETIRIEGTVDGDLIAAGQSVIVTGQVTGDVFAFCQRVQIDGRVDGSVRTGSQFLDLSGRVGRNVTSGGETIDLRPGAVVEGSMMLGAQRVNLDGHMGRDLMIGAEVNELNGTIGGGALIAGRRLIIGPGAEIQGEAKFHGAEEPEVSSEAKLASPLVVEIHEETPEYAKSETYVGAFLKWAAAFVFGLVGVLVMPGPYQKVVNTSARTGLSILIGLVASVVIPFVAIMICATLVGLPVGLTAIFVFVPALYAAQVFVGSWLGKEILGAASTQAQALGQLALGLAIIHAFQYVPYVGWLATMIIIFWGFGALVLAVTQRPRPAPASA